MDECCFFAGLGMGLRTKPRRNRLPKKRKIHPNRPHKPHILRARLSKRAIFTRTFVQCQQ